MNELAWNTVIGPVDSNPFVGPRPIQHGEALYGRSAEVDELYDRLQARRIVVLHSPSGAGKSSLVQAGLVPRLKLGNYDVWKPIRVNLDPQGLEGVPAGTNRYLLSAMVSLEDELPLGHRRSPAQLAALDFVEYLRTRPRRKAMKHRPLVLLFDQFEEVLTVAPRAVDARRELFSAIGKALDDEHHWALFIIREDYLAALAPYRERVPTYLANTFRLDLLGLPAAREAAEQLALSGGRRFPAAEQLVRDLSRVQLQQADGAFATEQGTHVEPVQMQVVCRRLWEVMPKDATSIEREHLEAYGDVSTSLAGYYADAMRLIAGTDTLLERTIRAWFGRELITGGHRSQVRQDLGTAGSLDGRVIGRLLDTYLVRSEQRVGANWFELSHDRLIEPILANNEAWDRAHLHPLQVQAKLWEDGGRALAMLLRSDALPSAMQWAAEHAALVTDAERKFLDASQARQEELLRQRRIWIAVMVTLALVAAAAVAFGVYAFRQREQAELDRKLAVAAEQVAVAAEQVAVAAKQVAVAARTAADEARQEADRDRKAADEAQQAAVEARLENERMARNVFEVTLRRFLQGLGKKSHTAGELVVDERWTPLLEWKEQKLAAANVVDGRIVAIGVDAMLQQVDEHGDSLFVEITTDLLLGNQTRRRIGIISQQPGAKARLETLRRILDKLDYEYEIDPPLTDAELLSTMGMLIIDNRWTSFSKPEVDAVDALIRRGGGVLAVGDGKSWLSRRPSAGEEPPTLASYPMNQLLGRYGVQWSEGTIDAKALERYGRKARVVFENRWGGPVELYSRNEQGVEALHATLSTGTELATVTLFGQDWVVRAAGAVIREVKVEAEDQRVVLEKPKPLPDRLTEDDWRRAKPAAERASRACGTSLRSLMPNVEVKVEVTPNGTVGTVKVVDERMQGTREDGCVTRKLARQRFPKTRLGGSKTWKLPL